MIFPFDALFALSAQVEAEGAAPTHFIMSWPEFFRGRRSRKSSRRWIAGVWGKQRANE